MIHSSIAARCDYPPKTFVDGTSRQGFCVSGVRGDSNRQTTDEWFDPLLPVLNSFTIPGEWIENDNGIGHVKKELQLSTMTETPQRNAKHGRTLRAWIRWVAASFCSEPQ
jgi:hypothetical protein